MTDQRHVDTLHEIMRTASNLASMLTDPVQIIIAIEMPAFNVVGS